MYLDEHSEEATVATLVVPIAKLVKVVVIVTAIVAATAAIEDALATDAAAAGVVYLRKLSRKLALNPSNPSNSNSPGLYCSWFSKSGITRVMQVEDWRLQGFTCGDHDCCFWLWLSLLR